MDCRGKTIQERERPRCTADPFYIATLVVSETNRHETDSSFVFPCQSYFGGVPGVCDWHVALCASLLEQW